MGAEPWPEPQSLPSAHWPALSGFLLFPPRHWSGAGFFPPQSFSSSPLPLPRPKDRSAPPAPSSSGREEFRKKVSQKFGLEEGREDRERKREREERKGEGGERENKKKMKSSLHSL